MDFRFSPEQEAIQKKVADVLRGEDTQQAWRNYLGNRGYFPHDLYKKVADAGLLRLGLPEEYGGRPASTMERLTLLESLSQLDLPIIFYVVLNTQYHIMAMIAEFGSDDLKRRYLPKIMDGSIKVAMGVSEPDAGSDAANISSSAADDGDAYIVNGSKIWNFAHLADYLLTSVKTDPEAPKRQGLSVLMIDLKSPGVNVTPIGMLGERRNQVFMDNVRVPKANVLGMEHNGWKAVTETLAAGRYYSGEMGSAIWLMKHVIQYARETRHDGRLLKDDPAVRGQLAQLASELEAVRIMYYRAGWMYDNGRSTITEGSIIKIISSELKVRMSGVILEILGAFGQLEWTAETEEIVPVRGKLIELYRALRPLNMIGGASNEIHRNILAGRHLGLRFAKK